LIAFDQFRINVRSGSPVFRGLYYLLKHTIEGTKEETFSDQGECDPVIEDCEVLLNSLREELHLYAQKKGDMVGDIVLVDRDDEIDCARMGSGGYGNGEIKIVRRWWHGPQIGSVAPADAILDRSEATITPTALHLGASEQDPLPGVSRAGLADWQRADRIARQTMYETAERLRSPLGPAQRHGRRSPRYAGQKRSGAWDFSESPLGGSGRVFCGFFMVSSCPFCV
jgi:hypothetical protein